MDCFSDFIDHGDGKYTIFGRVQAGIVGDAGSLHLRWANLPIPIAIAEQIDKYAVSVTITNPDNYTPFLAFEIGDTPNVIGSGYFITVKAISADGTKREGDYYCDYIVVGTGQKAPA
jgi:hypothetical protein